MDFQKVCSVEDPQSFAGGKGDTHFRFRDPYIVRSAFPIRFSERHRYREPCRNDSNICIFVHPNYPFPITTNMYAFPFQSLGTVTGVPRANVVSTSIAME